MLEMLAKVGAVGAGAVADEGGEGFGVEDGVVFGEEAEEEADEEALELVAAARVLRATAKAAGFQLIVELAHAGVGFFVGLVLGFVADAGLPEHEGEVPDVLGELGESEVVLFDLPPGEKREVELVLGFEVVEDEAGEVGDEDLTRDLIPAVFAGEVFDVGEGLGLSEG